MTAKEVAIDAIARMPEGISWEELMEELEILTDLRRADAEIDSGDFVTHDEVKREIATWFPK